jgi:hypothetical protein
MAHEVTGFEPRQLDQSWQQVSDVTSRRSPVGVQNPGAGDRAVVIEGQHSEPQDAPAASDAKLAAPSVASGFFAIGRPGDGQQKGAVSQGLYVVADSTIQDEEVAGWEVDGCRRRLASRAHADVSLDRLYRDPPRRLVLLDPSTPFSGPSRRS